MDSNRLDPTNVSIIAEIIFIFLIDCSVAVDNYLFSGNNVLSNWKAPRKQLGTKAALGDQEVTEDASLPKLYCEGSPGGRRGLSHGAVRGHQHLCHPRQEGDHRTQGYPAGLSHPQA